jgi:hypothetical protein
LLVEALSEHIHTHLTALNRLEQHGYDFPDRRVIILADAAHLKLGERIAAGVHGTVIIEPLTHDYYDGLRFMISARTRGGELVPLIDGGCFDWLRKLNSNNKLVFVASGLGSQIAAYLYRLPASDRRAGVKDA